jgi:hypothetical protein
MVMDKSALTCRAEGRDGMRLIGEVIAAFTIGAMVLALVGFGPSSPDQVLGLNSAYQALAPKSPHRTLGELRCEGRGAIVINVDGRDYAVNGLAGSRYPPIQNVWTENSHPEVDIDRLIVQGITLCDW